MIMLSRVAYQLYWMARYLERAEDMARTINTYTHFIMDLPKGTEFDWNVLIEISENENNSRYFNHKVKEQSVLRYIISSTKNPSSILSSVRCARENVRTTRNMLPSEVWEIANELYNFVEEESEQSVTRKNRFKFLSEVTEKCQLINGHIMTTVPRNHTYRFITLGHLIERADMTNRILRSSAAAISRRKFKNTTFDSLLWTNMLKATSTLGTYRQVVSPMIDGNSVIDYLYRNRDLPRSIIFCIDGILKDLKSFTENKEITKVLTKIHTRLNRFDVRGMGFEDYDKFSGDLQEMLDNLDYMIRDALFEVKQL